MTRFLPETWSGHGDNDQQFSKHSVCRWSCYPSIWRGIYPARCFQVGVENFPNGFGACDPVNNRWHFARVYQSQHTLNHH